MAKPPKINHEQQVLSRIHSDYGLVDRLQNGIKLKALVTYLEGMIDQFGVDASLDLEIDSGYNSSSVSVNVYWKTLETPEQRDERVLLLTQQYVNMVEAERLRREAAAEAKRKAKELTLTQLRKQAGAMGFELTKQKK